MAEHPDELQQRLASVRAYHERTKHQLQRYAAGPESLDWDAQPDPFRRYLGAPLESLLLVADQISTPWAELFVPGAIAPQPFHRTSLAALFELSFALAAWKEVGPDRWAVRCTPSSGNLHPTEAWLLTRGAAGLADGLYHYAAREHGLERRATFAPALPNPPTEPPRAFIALSSIHWREAWKYGERAFRYCQLDLGHALGALRYAAALQGWRLCEVPIGTAELATLLGLDRDADYGPAEREDAELLLELRPGSATSMQHPDPLPRDARPAPADSITTAVAVPQHWTATSTWAGQANRLDRHPMYRWPVIDAVAQASAIPTAAPAPAQPAPAAAMASLAERADASALARPAATDPPSPSASTLIRQRRSAQRFDSRARAPLAQLLPLLAALQSPRLPLDLPAAGADGSPCGAARVHLLVFAHRIDGLAPGAYLLPRRAQSEPLLRATFPAALDWTPVALPQTAGPIRLLHLGENPALAGTLRTINCHQALGSDAVAAFALLAEFDPVLGEPSPAPWQYRRLFQEAGLLGQVLYMEAEAAGLAGTGIGCYFDDALHQLVGLQGSVLQSLYHFTIGVRIDDPRISHVPPYADRAVPPTASEEPT
ncbi:MAG: nitroreductase [Leptothrix sp. (in: b-proteobacteria)]